MAVYYVTGLTGSDPGDLAALGIDKDNGPAGQLADLNATSMALYNDGTNVVPYVFDATGTDAESSPLVIRPNDYSTAGVWKRVVFGSGSLVDADTLDGVEGTGYLLSTGDIASGNYGFESRAYYKSDVNISNNKFQGDLVSLGNVNSMDFSDVPSGNLTHIDSDDQGNYACSVWGDGKFIYLANSDGGLHTYSVDNSGNLTHIDFDNQGDNARGVWGDGKFIYLANGNGGLHSYSVDNSGNLTHIDFDDQGDSARGVWGDGKFVYIANHDGGLHSYSVDDSGYLTHIDSDDQGDNAYSVWGDGKFIYLANNDGGLHSYSVDDSGNLTHIDSDDQGDYALSVWGDSKFVYLANHTGGLHSYSVDNSGNLTHIDSDDQGDNARGVWGDGKFIYLANGDGGLHTYSVDNSGNLTHIDFDDQGDNARGVWGDGKFIYLANNDGGLHSYSVDNAYEYNKGTQVHTFMGELNIDGDLSADYYIGSHDDITATSEGVAASVSTETTFVSTNGDSDEDNVTLADGTEGQTKYVACVAEGNAADTWRITPANMVGGTYISFAGAGEGCTLKMYSAGWVVVGNNGGTIN